MMWALYGIDPWEIGRWVRGFTEWLIAISVALAYVTLELGPWVVGSALRRRFSPDMEALRAASDRRHAAIRAAKEAAAPEAPEPPPEEEYSPLPPAWEELLRRSGHTKGGGSPRRPRS